MPSTTSHSSGHSSKSRSAAAAPVRPRFCHFCVNAISFIDYKDTRLLQRFTSSYGKIGQRRRTGTCAMHQRKLSQAIKRARFMALMPFTLR